MSRDLAVLDASPAIILHQIGRLDLLRDLFCTLVAPPAVAREVVPSPGTLPTWIDVRTPSVIPFLARRLDPGEREAVALSVQFAASVVVLDDLVARRRALQFGLNVTGSAGLLVLAKRRGFIQLVQPDLDAMMASGLHVGEQLYQDVLQPVGEADLPR